MLIGQFNVIEEFVDIADDVEIKHFNYIWKNVKIGKGSKIGSYCELEEGVVVGDNTVLQGRVRCGPNAVIGNNVIIKYGTIITDKAVIKDNVFIGPNVITLGSEPNTSKIYGTIINENCFIGAGVKISAGINICKGVAGSPIRCIKAF